MGIDPNELLIFKKRTALEEKAAKAPAKPVEKKPERQAQQEKPAQPARQEQKQEEKAGPVQASPPQGAPAYKEVDASRLACVNHPWRQAYALCEYCKRPFCYADIMPFHDKLYCLEDIDRATRMHLKPAETPSRFIYLTSLLFATSTILLIYLAYVPAKYLAISILGIGLSSALVGVFSQYIIPVADLLLALLSLASAVIIVRRSSGAFAFCATVLILTLIIMSYEYLGTNAQYIYVALSITLINMAFLAAAKMDVSGSTGAVQFGRPVEGIEWPRPELF